ncbi:tetratricopeptide repeat protein [Streptomyces ipomoeae]|uniref:Tetratricopeptide repeat protein n=2 Tax=Streptomyces ipomoeae TaxID=103232 RepID=L1L0U4_9ACTN|nr:hypothetical protein [Streptomyces ipomoeae]EKX66701.1 hypothetical protein STRIP9103_05938 [Streptomyces ipomoeae 91-03]MDX2698440.1 tetratricopeptide repeat protein [Streptomyces ipomoeae]MDX2823301.1 tetratricopeptide repeat protein [Streptomyces ipomoeae]MDX2844049.1 tetratricopeptide repeat protein [Streptomyces ipomoeae]MDX2878326.1 tetratricopeptide repeat protein [Streptomyces ipomoeae]
MSRFSRGEKKRQQSLPGAGQAAASGLTPIDVHVSSNGQATVGGMPVVAGPGESVQDAVLNYLHRLVLATGHTVAATVHDERIGFSTPLQVMADGSSHFMGEPVRLAGSVIADAGAAMAVPQQKVPDTQVAPEPPRQHERDRTTWLLSGVSDPSPDSTMSPEPTPTSTATGESSPTPGSAAPPVPATAPPPAAASVPAPAPAPAPVAASVPQAVPSPADAVAPSLLAEPVLRINEALQRGRIESAAAMAEQSIASATKTLGKEHPEVLQLRELTAYIAYLAGDAQRSFTLSMELARIRRRQRDARAYVNVQSAAAAWRAVRDPSQGLALGRELIGLWSELVVDGGPAAVEIRQLEAARARMDRLAERARGSLR